MQFLCKYRIIFRDRPFDRNVIYLPEMVEISEAVLRGDVGVGSEEEGFIGVIFQYFGDGLMMWVQFHIESLSFLCLMGPMVAGVQTREY